MSWRCPLCLLLLLLPHRRGWPPGEAPHYDADYALVLCHMRCFTQGLLFLYEVGAWWWVLVGAGRQALVGGGWVALCSWRWE